MSPQAVRAEDRDGTALLRWDDGKANAVSSVALAELGDALDRAEKDGASAVAIAGRPGVFCAGFDLKELAQGNEAMFRLVRGGALLLARLYGFPLPVVVGCSGHALGMGALLLLAADARIGARGDHRIALNEVSIKLALPTFGIALADDRLSRRHLQRAAGQAETYDPESAIDAGFLDRVVDPADLESALAAEAARLGALPRGAFAATKQRMRAATIQRIRASLDAEFGGA